MLTWLFLTAFGAELVVGEPTDTRRYKIEAFGYSPTPGKRYNLDWRPVDLHYWSGLIECTRTGKRTDTCTFVDDKLELGLVVRGVGKVQAFDVIAPERFEIHWNKQGRVAIDLQGDLDNFYKSSADALLARYHKPESVAWHPDQWRRVGQTLADELRYWFGGALEAHLPRDRSGETGWKTKTPLVAQTWESSTVGGGGDMRIVSTEGPIHMFHGKGRIAEQHFSYRDHMNKGVFTLDTGWDASRGVPVSNRIAIEYEVHMAGYYTKRMVLMTEATDAHEVACCELEGSPLGPTTPEP